MKSRRCTSLRARVVWRWRACRRRGRTRTRPPCPWCVRFSRVTSLTRKYKLKLSDSAQLGCREHRVSNEDGQLSVRGGIHSNSLSALCSASRVSRFWGNGRRAPSVVMWAKRVSLFRTLPLVGCHVTLVNSDSGRVTLSSIFCSRVASVEPTNLESITCRNMASRLFCDMCLIRTADKEAMNPHSS